MWCQGMTWSMCRQAVVAVCFFFILRVTAMNKLNASWPGGGSSEAKFLIGIGVEKAGTTTFFDIISQHPQIIPSNEKQLLFWERQPGATATVKTYLERWNQTLGNEGPPVDKVLLEFSPDYFRYPYVPQRIHNVLPHAKFILLLREPIERWFSQVNMRRRLCTGFEMASRACCGTFVHMRDLVDANKQVAKDYEECLAGSDPAHCTSLDNNPFSKSLFPAELKVWFKYFDPSQFLILHYEALKDENAVMQRVIEFAGLDEFTLQKENSDTRSHSADYYFSDLIGEVDQWLVDFFDRQNEELYRELKSHGFAFAPFAPYKPRSTSALDVPVIDIHEGAVTCCEKRWGDSPLEDRDMFCKKLRRGERLLATDLKVQFVPHQGTEEQPRELKHSTTFFGDQKKTEALIVEQRRGFGVSVGYVSIAIPTIFLAIALYALRPRHNQRA